MEPRVSTARRLETVAAGSRRNRRPELYELFGNQHLMRFLDLFAGTRFEVPSRDLILTALRDADIYARLAARKDTVRAWQRNTGWKSIGWRTRMPGWPR